MDLLTTALSQIHLRSPLLADFRLGDGAVSFSHENGAPFYYGVDGTARIVVDGVARELSRGSLLVLKTWPAHRLEGGAAKQAHSIIDLIDRHNLPYWSTENGINQPLKLCVGQAPYSARVLCGIFVFDQPHATFLFDAIPEILAVDPDDIAVKPWIDASLNFLDAELAEPKAGFSAAAGRVLELLLIQLLRRHLLQANQPKGFIRGYNDARLRKALVAIHESPARNWTLEQLAEVASLSRSRFAKLFVQALGETPFVYLTRWRLHVAARLLSAGQSVATVAQASGYADSFSFARAFKTLYECTPSAYRARAISDHGILK